MKFTVHYLITDPADHGGVLRTSLQPIEGIVEVEAQHPVEALWETVDKIYKERPVLLGKHDQISFRFEGT